MPEQVQEMVRALREERGRERTAENNAAQRRPEISTAPRPFAGLSSQATPGRAQPGSKDALEQAQAHRDRLLGFQASNAARTRVIDEAAAFETPDMGVSQWGSAVQRAAQLKRQQAMLREMEWNARPDYEKRRMVVSVDLVGGKVVKKMSAVKREDALPVESTSDDPYAGEDAQAVDPTDRPAPFSNNPLLGALIRPVWQASAVKASGEPSHFAAGCANRDEHQNGHIRSTWRRVQDDADNEHVILDGGAYGVAQTA